MLSHLLKSSIEPQHPSLDQDSRYLIDSSALYFSTCFWSLLSSRIEGKIEVVLHSIIENGFDVKVKLKQRKPIMVFHSTYCCNFFL